MLIYWVAKLKDDEITVKELSFNYFSEAHFEVVFTPGDEAEK